MSTTNGNTAQDKTVARIRKLLALAADGGATEAEASLAMERAQQIMAEHGLHMATIEASGENVGEPREKVQDRGYGGNKKWAVELIKALAKQYLCSAEWSPGYRDSYNGVRVPSRYTIIGRQSAVATVRVMHEYLVRTIDRMARERGTPSDEVFKRAMGERLVERVNERTDAELAERHATAEKARAQPAQRGGSTAVAVIMEDFAQKERDLNEDMRRGLKPGTTAQQRLEEEAENAARRQRLAEKEAEYVAQGYDAERAYYLSRGWSVEQVEKIFAPKTVEVKPLTDAEKRRNERAYRAERERAQQRQEREFRLRNSKSYREGRTAGDAVGLDKQINKK